MGYIRSSLGSRGLVLNVRYVSMLNTLQKKQEKLPTQSLDAFMFLCSPLLLHHFICSFMTAELFDRMERLSGIDGDELHLVKSLAFHGRSATRECREGGRRMNGDASLICSQCGFNDTPGTLHQICGVKSET